MKKVQLTHEQHWFELCESTYMQILFNKYGTILLIYFLFLVIFLNIFFSQAYFKDRVCYTYNIYKISVNCVLMRLCYR